MFGLGGDDLIQMPLRIYQQAHAIMMSVTCVHVSVFQGDFRLLRSLYLSILAVVL